MSCVSAQYYESIKLHLYEQTSMSSSKQTLHGSGIGSVTLSSNAVIVNGEPTWLISGSVHYFRIPRHDWRSCLQLCVDGGLNCIDTYIAWNIHEVKEGVYEFEGEQDLEHFIGIANELGLYVIIRVGPFICAEHRLGGYPTWLMQKKGVVLREPTPEHNEYVKRWFDVILPKIAALQISRKGPVVLVQCENEYAFHGRPGGEEYLRSLHDGIRDSGIDVPIITCNSLVAPMDDAVDCYNGRSEFTRWLNKFGAAQEGKPRIVAEYYPGWFSIWDEQHVEHRSPRQVFRDVIDITANGGMLNYYMYAGGTNFGFQAGRSGLGRNRFITTSYDYQAPIGEGLLVGEKYAYTRLANRIIRLFSKDFVESTYKPVSAPRSGWCVIERDVAAGKLLFVLKREEAGDTAADIHTSLGDNIQIDADECDAFLLPYRYLMSDDLYIDSTCFQPFHADGARLFLTGSKGARGYVTINGERKQVTVPSIDGQVAEVVVGGATLMLMSFRSAAYAKVVQGDMVIECSADMHSEDDAHAPKNRTVIDSSGLIHTSLGQGDGLPESPIIVDIERINDLCRLDSKKNGFRSIESPEPIESLDPDCGYLWYSFEFTANESIQENIVFAGAADRVHLFVDGRRQGVYGPGTGASTSPIPVSIKRGRNRWVLLVDALGYRNSTLPLEDPKGIWRTPECAIEITPTSRNVSASQHPGAEYEPEWESARRHEASISEYWENAFQFNVDSMSGNRLWLKIRPFTSGTMAWIFLNNKLIATHDGSANSNQRDIFIDAQQINPVNELRVVVEGRKTYAEVLEVGILALRDIEGLECSWSYSEWRRPVEDGIRIANALHGPSWWRFKFYLPDKSEYPLFLQCDGMSKGVIYLNGHNVGRYWRGSSQRYYYLPYLNHGGGNIIEVFDEEGLAPDQARLTYLDRPVSEYYLNNQSDTVSSYQWENNV